jgi:hypothetical protein
MALRQKKSRIETGDEIALRSNAFCSRNVEWAALADARTSRSAAFASAFCLWANSARRGQHRFLKSLWCQATYAY